MCIKISFVIILDRYLNRLRTLLIDLNKLFSYILCKLASFRVVLVKQIHGR